MINKINDKAGPTIKGYKFFYKYMPKGVDIDLFCWYCRTINMPFLLWE